MCEEKVKVPVARSWGRVGIKESEGLTTSRAHALNARVSRTFEQQTAPMRTSQGDFPKEHLETSS